MSKKSAVETFVEGERAKGKSDAQIQDKLLDAGWHMDIIHWAMGKQNGQRATPIVADHHKSPVNPTKDLLFGGIILAVIFGFKKLRPSKRLAK